MLFGLNYIELNYNRFSILDRKTEKARTWVSENTWTGKVNLIISIVGKLSGLFWGETVTNQQNFKINHL